MKKEKLKRLYNVVDEIYDLIVKEIKLQTAKEILEILSIPKGISPYYDRVEVVRKKFNLKGEK